jgi:8-oxo-dGTP pyrophosphatase MutT (NUDIX family)
MRFADAITRLEERFRFPLPGEAAQMRLSPRPRREWPADFQEAQIRHAAGLLLMFPIDDRAHIVLTVRAETLRHAGQVSLPGGVVERGETLEQAALREAHEEIGLDAETVRLLAPLTPLDIPVSGFRLHPIVGVLATRPPLRAADGEVAAVLELDIDELLAPGQPRQAERVAAGAPIVIPGFHVRGYEIWGATAMVLAEFLALLEWPASD